MQLAGARYTLRFWALFASWSRPLLAWQLHIRAGKKRHHEQTRMDPAHSRMSSRHVPSSPKITSTIYPASKQCVNFFCNSYSSMYFLHARRRKGGRNWCLQSKTGQTCWWCRKEGLDHKIGIRGVTCPAWQRVALCCYLSLVPSRPPRSSCSWLQRLFFGFSCPEISVFFPSTLSSGGQQHSPIRDAIVYCDNLG